MTITLALKQKNLDILDEIFWSVSDPKSDNFRNFVPQQQINNLVAPSDFEINQLKEWLHKQNIDESNIELNPSRDFLILRSISPEIISTTFQCQLQVFINPSVDRLAQVCVSGYSLPKEIANAVDFVGGLTHFPKGKSLPKLEARNKKASNEPIVVKKFPGDENFSLYFAPLCGDGSVPGANFHCSDGQNIDGFQVTARQFTSTYKLELSTNELVCKNCSSWSAGLQSYCNQANDEYSLPDYTLYCHSGTIIPGFSNYVPVEVSLFTQFVEQFSAAATPYPLFMGEFVTPKTLKEYYGVTEEQAICTNPMNKQSVAEFLGQFYSPTDLVEFFKMTGVRYPGHVELVGPNFQSIPGIEASLDIQYLMGVAQNVTTYFWSLGRLHQGQEPFLEWITQVLNAQDPPFVHSISYGDDESSLTSDYMNRINVEFKKAGSIGITLMFSSGDNGVNAADPSAPSCADIQAFTPGFPASSPYVTAVGGTQFSSRSEAICSSITQYGVPVSCSSVGEIAASIATGARITSGGGFSNVFPMPDYQKAVVNNYLKSQSVPSQYYNASGRAYPDISACARNFLVINDGELHPTDGTSAAAPTAAALMTLINDKLLGQHEKLGFVNPTLYSISENNFNDIIQGDNKCGEDITACCDYGFTTEFGWDAVTGLGTINFPNLLQTMIDQ